jgi:hypothetical protein
VKAGGWGLGVSFTIRVNGLAGAAGGASSTVANPILVSELCSERNPFFDPGAIKFYDAVGAAMPPTAFTQRKVLTATTWSVSPLLVQAGSCFATSPGERVLRPLFFCTQHLRRRFDFPSSRYCAGILEEDDPLQPMSHVLRHGPNLGRTFTLFFFDGASERVIFAALHARLVGGILCSV